MSQSVPLRAVPNQTLAVLLANQACQLNIYTTTDGRLYMDVIVNNQLVIGGVICQDRNRIVRSVYLGFIGDFCFVDTQGTSDPVYTGLGTRFLLQYLETTDLGRLG